MQTKDWPDVTPGSIIAFTGRATRGSEGETREIFALVMSQEPFDGSLTCFAFHFEGQFQAVLMPVTRTPVRGADGTLTGMDVQPTFRMVFDAGSVPEMAKECARFDAYIEGLDDKFEAFRDAVRAQFTEFQTQVLEMITADRTPTGGLAGLAAATAATEAARVESTRKPK